MGDVDTQVDGAETAVLVWAEPLLSATSRDVAFRDPGVTARFIEVVYRFDTRRLNLDDAGCPIAAGKIRPQGGFLHPHLLVFVGQTYLLKETSETLTGDDHIMFGTVIPDDSPLKIMAFARTGTHASMDAKH
jgi:hypothetical protein